MERDGSWLAIGNLLNKDMDEDEVKQLQFREDAAGAKRVHEEGIDEKTESDDSDPPMVRAHLRCYP